MTEAHEIEVRPIKWTPPPPEPRIKYNPMPPDDVEKRDPPRLNTMESKPGLKAGEIGLVRPQRLVEIEQLHGKGCWEAAPWSGPERVVLKRHTLIVVPWAKFEPTKKKR